ncbi:MAG: hypothetical protein D4R64_08565 [Porphyromonadaceae bacterium]|nr:MAG: hypothetical protein D4R64_08565 [Porphyromonadaceae bacterium]
MVFHKVRPIIILLSYMKRLMNPDYDIYSKNQLNFNSLVFGWKRQVFSSHSFKGYFSLDLGYNNPVDDSLKRGKKKDRKGQFGTH